MRCPFHDDAEPSCKIYPDHWFCYGCGERGNRLDWLMRVEGMTEAEAISFIKDWPCWRHANGRLYVTKHLPDIFPRGTRGKAGKASFHQSLWLCSCCAMSSAKILARSSSFLTTT
jgi:hypothetical protein